MAEPRREDSGRTLASKVIDNLTVPWLLYNCALGALAWQGIIIPAFLHDASSQRHRATATATDRSPERHSLAIPLSIALGLLLPASLMLLSPRNPALIILFLLFPIWISLTRSLLTHPHPPGGFTKLTNKTTSPTLIYAPAILASTAAHAALLLTHLGPSSTDTLKDHTSTTTRAALLLLELDHAAIFLAVLYWLYHLDNTDSGRRRGHRSVLLAVAVSLVIGPGAGICVGWMDRRRSDRDNTHQQAAGKKLSALLLPLPFALTIILLFG